MASTSANTAVYKQRVRPRYFAVIPSLLLNNCMMRLRCPWVCRKPSLRTYLCLPYLRRLPHSIQVILPFPPRVLSRLCQLKTGTRHYVEVAGCTSCSAPARCPDKAGDSSHSVFKMDNCI